MLDYEGVRDMTKNKALFLTVLAFLCLSAAFGTAQAQGLTFTPYGETDSATDSGGGDDDGLGMPASPYGTEQPDSGPSSSGTSKLGTIYHPQWTKDFAVAADYYKLIGKLPDFAQWVQNSDAFKAVKGNPFTQKQVLDNMTKQYAAMFDNASVADDIVIHLRVHLSKYSKVNQGFIVLNGFSNQAYFRYHFGGQDFAVVPQHLGDEENTWIPVPEGHIADDLIKSASFHGYDMNVALFVKPVYADAAAGPAPLDEDSSYYLLSGKVTNIMILDTEDRVLWERNTNQYTENQKNDLLNLKQ
jgi:hypothetical protein